MIVRYCLEMTEILSCELNFLETVFKRLKWNKNECQVVYIRSWILVCRRWFCDHPFTLLLIQFINVSNCGNYQDHVFPYKAHTFKSGFYTFDRVSNHHRRRRTDSTWMLMEVSVRRSVGQLRKAGGSGDLYSERLGFNARGRFNMS